MGKDGRLFRCWRSAVTFSIGLVMGGLAGAVIWLWLYEGRPVGLIFVFVGGLAVGLLAAVFRDRFWDLLEGWWNWF